jgi:hypothetical protein
VSEMRPDGVRSEIQRSEIVVRIRWHAGAHIERCCEEAVMLASRLGATITFEFNGVHMDVGPAANAQERVSYFHEQLRKGSTR